MIERRLRRVDVRAHQQKIQAIYQQRVSEPLPVEGITKAAKTVSYSFDPSYRVEVDIYLPGGKLLHAAGTTINPLELISWPDKLLFINGQDQSQVAWAAQRHLKSAKSAASATKIILIAGRPAIFEKAMGRVYFDQAGALTSKFKITHVPAIVEQDGKYLKITEINLDQVD